MSMQRQYEFAILGPGALGSIIGGHLARAGHSVAMLARGRRAELIARNGVVLTGLTELSTPVDVMTDPAALRSAGVLIVATKTPGTEEALARLRHVDVGLAFSVQNGVMKNDLLTSVFGADRVLGSLADTSGEVLADGRVLFSRNVRLILGELSGELSDRARNVAATIDTSGVRAVAVENVLSLEWSKYVTWVGMFALAVTTRTVTWRYLTDPDAATVLVRLTREMGRLAAARGVEVTDEANMPAASMLRGTEAEAVAEVVKRGRVFEAHAPEHRLSSLQDLLAGRPLEVHETLGYAVRKGASLGIEMPLLDGFYRVIAAAERLREGAAG
ncbi:MAG: ketopantoate reductase family protein [Proteobacteria bacterium]|nr:ketopantoate reductase family protein [Pseudomonadota bacterium]